MPVFLLTINVPVEVSRISFNVTNQVVYIQIKLLLTSALIALLKDSNFDLSLLLPFFLALACVLFLVRIFLLISEVIQGTEEVDLLVFEGICFSADS